MGPYRAISALTAVLLALGLSSCEPVLHIEGSAFDIRGQALPGVAVTLGDSRIQAQTDGLGRYRLSCPGSYLNVRDAGLPLQLGFIKTGYGSARMALEVPREAGSVAAPDVVLWHLPVEDGVFLLEDLRYQRMTSAMVRQYLSPVRGPCFGTKKLAELTTTHTAPRIYSHRLYGYDLQLVRLDLVEALEIVESEMPDAADARSYDETIWVAGESVPIAATPIDEPERLLYEVLPGAPLAPGHYAVHWGALDGFLGTEPRVFLFDVVDADAEQSVAENADETAAEEEPTPNE